jgi:Na+-driven multidrug efflux pump
MGTILTIFIVAFFVVSVGALIASIFHGKNTDISKNCRTASLMAFIIGLILMYLQFVFSSP